MKALPPRRRPRGARSAMVVAIVAGALLATSCATHGARTIHRARFDYNEAIVRTWNEQMLLNLVRLRYRDTPFFLEINGVSTQYAFQGDASASALIGVDGGSGNEVGGGVGFGYAERPTISYVPLQGEKFATQLMTPIPIETLELLSGSGWRADRVYRTAVQSINGVENARTASGPTPDRAPEYEAFDRILGLLRKLQVARAIDAVADRTEAGDRRLFMRIRPRDDASVASARELKELLGLSLDRETFPMHQGPGTIEEDAIVITTRSLLSVLFYLSHTVEAPERDVEAGAVTRTVDAEGRTFDWQRVSGGLFRVLAADEPPDGAFIRVHYRGAWFYIRDDDLDTKSTFGLLSQLFNLQAGQAASGGPVLTLPVGG